MVDEQAGWDRSGWERVTGVTGSGGRASRTPARMWLRHHAGPIPTSGFSGAIRPIPMSSRRVELGTAEDPMEAAFARGWTDGLPVVPPTEERVARMLEGADLPPGQVLCTLPPDLAECTVEKVAINAVMAGCRPEYLPVVLAAVKAAAGRGFNIHGVSATTYFSGPVLIVNGPVRGQIGMNSGVNVLGQGNRANLTIGRALNLVVRNVGGARPGGVDQATFGSPSKLAFCFPEDEEGSPWESLAVQRGFEPEESTVTLFAAHGPIEVVDQKSRTPESLARTLALQLRMVAHPKLAGMSEAIVVVSPEHGPALPGGRMDEGPSGRGDPLAAHASSLGDGGRGG